MRFTSRWLALSMFVTCCGAWAACAATESGSDDPGSGGGKTGSGGASGGAGGDGGTPSFSVGSGGSGAGSTGGGIDRDPETCAEAATYRSYVGCDFWPTVTYNPVYSLFDFTAVVANASAQPAEVRVTRGDAEVASVTIPPGSLERVYLPWVPELKGRDFDGCTNGGRPTASVRVNDGAYHLTSTVPVTVWQFNPLEYKAGSGGPPGKDWTCPHAPSLCNGNGVDCLSVSNDAALLLPATALTGNYRLFGKSGAMTGYADPTLDSDTPAAYAITGTQDGTQVSIKLAPGADVVGGSGVIAASGGQEMTFTLDAGDVVELLAKRGAVFGGPNADLSGSLILADRPVQVISLIPISNIPTPVVANNGYADHLEETLVPAEVLGDDYLVAPPSTPQGNQVKHVVRLYGNRDGTTLTYPSGNPPPGAPTTLGAGQVVELGPLSDAFEVKGSHEFAVGSFMMGGQVQDPPNGTRGDPAFSLMVSTAQFRKKYIFLAPTDYDVSYADIFLPAGAVVTLDGAPLSAAPTPIGSSGWSIARALLGSSDRNGTHVLESDKEVGLQVMGFGHATAYYYPGGLNLKLIAPPPDVPL